MPLSDWTEGKPACGALSALMIDVEGPSRLWVVPWLGRLVLRYVRS